MKLGKPKRRLFGHTWLGWLNILLLQWMFMRLAFSAPAPQVHDRDNREFEWVIMWRVVPLSGFGGKPLRFIGSHK